MEGGLTGKGGCSRGDHKGQGHGWKHAKRKANATRFALRFTTHALALELRCCGIAAAGGGSCLLLLLLQAIHLHLQPHALAAGSSQLLLSPAGAKLSSRGSRQRSRLCLLQRGLQVGDIALRLQAGGRRREAGLMRRGQVRHKLQANNCRHCLISSSGRQGCTRA